MIKVATIGLGNCGNQICELALNQHKIPGIAINSSQKDLSTVKSVMKITLGDSLGAGKNRDEAKRFVKEQVRNLLGESEFTKHITENDVIFIISSTGGGTGSGMAPILCDILSRSFPKKQFILVEVYPPIREALASQQNTIDFLKEVRTNLPNVAYMCYDNNKYSDLPLNEMMRKVNEEIVDMMVCIRGDYQYPTPYESIDEKDMTTILNTPGRLAVFELSNIKEKDLDKCDIEDMLLDVIKNTSSNVEMDRDKVVKRIGIITNLTTKLNPSFDPNVKKLKDLIGEPAELFQHTYISDSLAETRIVLILAGLSVPDDRLEKMVERIEEGLEALAKTKSSSVLDDLDTDEIKSARTGNAKGGADFDLDDLLSMY